MAALTILLTWIEYVHTKKREVVMITRTHKLDDANETVRVLIAQYTAAHTAGSSHSTGSPYDQLLNRTSPINQAYARKFGYDYLIFRGTPFVDPGHEEEDSSYQLERYVVGGQPARTAGNDVSSSHVVATSSRPSKRIQPPPSRATYSKVSILELVLFGEYKGRFDYVLILDADAMMFDFDRDIGRYYDHHRFVLVAQKTNMSDRDETGSINVGVTLWNLNSKLTPLIVGRWKHKCLRRIREGRPDDDQAPLQALIKNELRQEQRNYVVHGVNEDFHYGKGTFVKHFIRQSLSWNDTQLERRLEKIQSASAEVCERYHPLCEQ